MTHGKQTKHSVDRSQGQDLLKELWQPEDSNTTYFDDGLSASKVYYIKKSVLLRLFQLLSGTTVKNTHRISNEIHSLRCWKCYGADDLDLNTTTKNKSTLTNNSYASTNNPPQRS